MAMETPSQPANELNEDVSTMRMLWVNELNAPEILQYDEDMVVEMLEQIRNQQDFVDSVYEERAQLTEEKSFVNKLYQMEIDRLRYMVSSYLRTRLRKIEKFAIHILSDPERAQRLSLKERNYAQQFVGLFESHVNDLALAKFPKDHSSIMDEGMVAEPNLDCFVFCEGKGEAGGLQVDDEGANYIQVHPTDRYVLRYRCVGDHVKSGEIELI